MSRPWLSLFLLLAVGGLLGLIGNVAKLAAASGWPPVALLLWSLLGAGGLLCLLALARGEAPSLSRPYLRYYLISGLVSISLPNALLFSAIPHVGAGFASLCLAFPPLLTYVLALALRMEGLQRVRLLGILIGLAGSLILALGKLGSSDSPVLWVLATLVMPVFLAIGNVYRSRHWPEGARPLQLAPGMLLAGALLLLPLGLFGVELRPAWEHAAGAWWLAAEVALFAGMYALYFVLQKVAGAVYLSQIGSVTAITGAAVAIFLLGEQGSASMLLAALCTTLGVALVALRAAR
ncbi:DMT family transporter [Pseudomonas sp. BLCC-B13]|uniref:DMT family transporter n=1 Tax=Pseudomonas sp. BLCC-B13 TaxID=3025314 RepID=UPI00234EB1FB|nr:DMT family transporter [Pseudomonas sp. BLCC-B13]MDC7824366.1 DMT family transporter [Pseudomonas sp. BLCC-B13]